MMTTISLRWLPISVIQIISDILEIHTNDFFPSVFYPYLWVRLEVNLSVD